MNAVGLQGPVTAEALFRHAQAAGLTVVEEGFGAGLDGFRLCDADGASDIYGLVYDEVLLLYLSADAVLSNQIGLASLRAAGLHVELNHRGEYLIRLTDGDMTMRLRNALPGLRRRQ